MLCIAVIESGVSPSGKATDSDSVSRGFESLHPNPFDTPASRFYEMQVFLLLWYLLRSARNSKRSHMAHAL